MEAVVVKLLIGGTGNKLHNWMEIELNNSVWYVFQIDSGSIKEYSNQPIIVVDIL